MDKVEPAGGKVSRAQTYISDYFGIMALVEDTEGNRIALRSSK